MEELASGSAGNRIVAYRKVKGMHPDILAYLTLKNIVAGISVVRTLHAVAVAIGTAIEDELRLGAIREADKKKYESIVAGAKKRSSDYYKHVYAVRRANHMDDGWDEWTPVERLQVGVRMIDLTVESIGLVEITNEAEGFTKTEKYLKPLPETLEWIENRSDCADASGLRADGRPAS
jgi:DNA-directed RNA polymerase